MGQAIDNPETSMLNRLILFRKWTGTTLFFVYMVICAGAVVRATGSGMGCPDWPRCFGSWIPPLEESDLPADYKEKYATTHIEVAEFNVYKTWTEYINRLAGALLGIVAFVTLCISFTIRKKRADLFWSTLLILLLIGFEGWLGKTVVDSNLSPVKITVHMITALVIMCLCLFTYYRAMVTTISWDPTFYKMRVLMFITLLISLIQVVLGTQIREEVDTFTASPIPIPRSDWAAMLGTSFIIHRSFSILVLLINAWIFYKLRNTALGRMALIAFGFVVLEAIVGIIMANAEFPAWSQPVHLVSATVIVGIQGWILVRLFPPPVHLGIT